MIEKVNPCHPDKMADRIAGAIVDLAYKKDNNPKIAVEVLIGHNECNVIIETNIEIIKTEVMTIVERITKSNDIKLNLKVVPQDKYLAENQKGKNRCGDNGIFKGVPLTNNEIELSKIVKMEYEKYPSDGKYILTSDTLIACQSNVNNDVLTQDLKGIRKNLIINPLGEWTGGINVDSGATNRKLGSDMAQSVTGGGLHGKDLSKADVSVNIYAFLKAQRTGKVVKLSCAIGDEYVDGKPYYMIVEEARDYIRSIGGFEKFAEWGLF